MAAISLYRTTADLTTGTQIGALWQRFTAWTDKWAEAARVAAELDQLDDRSLADLGLGRCDIPKIARAIRQA